MENSAPRSTKKSALRSTAKLRSVLDDHEAAPCARDHDIDYRVAAIVERCTPRSRRHNGAEHSGSAEALCATENVYFLRSHTHWLATPPLRRGPGRGEPESE